MLEQIKPIKMENILYYTIEKETQTIGEIEECTGHKTVTVYNIKNDIPKILFSIDLLNEEDSEEEIRVLLDGNEYNVFENCKLVLL